MSDEKPIDEIIGDGADAGPGADGPRAAPQTTSDPAGDAPADHNDRSWTVAALQDERSKRRRAQEETAELKQRLASYEENQTPASPSDQFWADPDRVLSHVHQATSNATLRASRAEHVATHGKASYQQIEDAVGAAMERGDPDMLLLRDAMLQSDDPVAVAGAWYEHHTGRSPHRAASAYPSNLATTRSVGARRGPAWTGPSSLEDIFDRSRK